MDFHEIYANKTIGITELKRHPGLMDYVNEPIAVLKRDTVKCYLVPEKFMKNITNILDEIQLVKLVNKRIKEELHLATEVSIDDL